MGVVKRYKYPLNKCKDNIQQKQSNGQVIQLLLKYKNYWLTNSFFILARPTRIERAAPTFGGLCSIP